MNELNLKEISKLTMEDFLREDQYNVDLIFSVLASKVYDSLKYINNGLRKKKRDEIIIDVTNTLRQKTNLSDEAYFTKFLNGIINLIKEIVINDFSEKNIILNDVKMYEKNKNIFIANINGLVRKFITDYKKNHN